MAAISAAAVGKIGLGVVKGLFSPVGITIVSILSIILMGFNPLFLGFDLVIKSIHVLSGNAMIQAALDGTFEPSSPIFIIYITVFIASFVIIVIKVIKNSLQDVAISKDFRKDSQNVKTMTAINGTKMKWVLIWLVSWFVLPFVFGIILYVLNLFIGLFALTPLSISVFERYKIADWDTSVDALYSSLNTEREKVREILDLFFPTDISSVTDVPSFLKKENITLEQWKNFLSESVKVTEISDFRDQLRLLDTKLTNMMNSSIFNLKGVGVSNTTFKQTADLISDINEKIRAINPFIQENLKINALNIGFIKVIPLVFGDSETIQSTFVNEVENIGTTINSLQSNIAATINAGKLPGIFSLGIDGQKEDVVNGFGQYKAETLTIALAQALYQNPNIFSMYQTISANEFDFGLTNIPVVGGLFGPNTHFGMVISQLGRFVTILSDPLIVVELSISTFAFAFCFTTFYSLLLMFAKKLFEYVSMLAVAPFATSEGITDGGEKFSIWWKTLFGKMIVVAAISVSLSIFTAVLNIAGDFLKNGIFNTGWEMDFIFRRILVKFLLMTIVIATSGEMLNFIGWVGQTFSVDNKLDKYRGGFTQKQAALIDRGTNAYKQHQQSIKTKTSIEANKAKTEAFGRFKTGSIVNPPSNGK